MTSRLLLLALAAGLVACSGKVKLREPAELKDIEAPAVQPQKLWSDSAGKGSGDYFSGLVTAVGPDAVFTADVAGRIEARSPATGQRLWRAETKARVISGPSLTGAAVLVGTMDGEVIAVKRSDGTPLWQVKLGSEILAPPAGDGDVVVARAGDGKIYGLSAASGTRLWVYDSSVPNLTLRGLSMPQVSGNRVFAGLDNGRVAALRLGDGQPAWEQVVAAPTGRNELERLTDVDAIVLVDGPEVFAVSFGGEIVCLAADSGRVIWRRSVKSYSGIARLGDLVVVTDDAGVVWGLEAQSGAAVWKNEDLAWRKLSAPAVYRGSLVVGDYKGYLHWLDPKDGRIVARSRAGSDPIQAAPVAQSDILYVLGTGGRLTALRVN